MAQWLSPTGGADIEADVRVGGALRVVMLGEGIRIDHSGEYLVVDPPRKLVFTWRSAYTGLEPSIVSVVLTPRGAETLLLITHEQLPAETAASHEGGWGSILDNLVDVLGAVDAAGRTAATANPSPPGERA